MDVRHAGTRTPPALTGEEVAAVVALLQALRRRRDAGDLSTDDHAQLVRSVLERRRGPTRIHHPERRGTGQDVGDA